MSATSMTNRRRVMYSCALCDERSRTWPLRGLLISGITGQEYRELIIGSKDNTDLVLICNKSERKAISGPIT